MRQLVTSPTAIVKDSFIDTNATSLASHSPDIQYNGGWVQTDPTSFYIQSNTLQPNRYTDKDLAYLETGISDFTITATVTPFNSGGNRGDPGILFRYTDTSNYWYLYPESDGPIFVINKYVAGVATTMMIMKSFPMSSGGKLNVRIDGIGENIIFYINGVEIVTVTDSFNQTATKHGVYLRKSNAPASPPSWNSFQVQPFMGTKIIWPDFTEQTPVTPSIALGVSGFDSVDVNDSSVQYDSVNNQWAMTYSGNDGTNVQDMGLATSPNITGPWTKSGSNPVLLSAGGDTFGMNGGMIMLGTTWYCYYGTTTGSKIHVATSPDLVTWTDQGVALDVGNAGKWDSGGVYDAFARVRQDGKTIELWYAGKATGTDGIGFATSTDGLTFTRAQGCPIFGILPFSAGNLGEPNVYVPDGQEGKQMLISFQGSKYNVSTTRFICQAITFNGGITWHFRINALVGNGAGWESVQVFDPDIIIDNNIMYLFHAGSNTTGNALSIASQIGYATADFSSNKFIGI